MWTLSTAPSQENKQRIQYIRFGLRRRPRRWCGEHTGEQIVVCIEAGCRNHVHGTLRSRAGCRGFERDAAAPGQERRSRVQGEHRSAIGPNFTLGGTAPLATVSCALWAAAGRGRPVSSAVASAKSESGATEPPSSSGAEPSASELREQDDLFARALAAKSRGAERQAIAGFEPLVARYPSSSLVSSFCSCAIGGSNSE
jgi:hypothetical protein